ncbi:MAG TPA: PD-(D/E)XK nuclease superfamily protein [Dehalococcoidia bacterium]|jgi:hypothetical protein|nr:PD-(D/E)XK nuclease superfamily protein [Dehalococcoidia bacterium]
MSERDQPALPDFLTAEDEEAGAEAARSPSASGAAFEERVAGVIEELGLSYLRQVSMGVSILGRKRVTDFLVYDRQGRSLGIECKYQAVSGSAEDKLVHTISDFDARPVKHILVFGGEGFSKNVSGYLLSTGKAIPIEDLRGYLVFYFGLADRYPEFGRK